MQRGHPIGWTPEEFGIHASPSASVISNPRLLDNPIVAANDAFCALTGYRTGDIIGRNCRFRAGPPTEPWLTDAILTGTREKRSVLVEILNYRRDGTPFRNAVLVAPIFAGDGALAYYIGTQCKVTEPGATATTERSRSACAKVHQLSPRQRQILIEIAAGYSSKEIGYHLSLSEKTIKMHRALLFAKLDVPSMAVAVEAGL